eukprot:8488419-Heterocapsa_arctica.AAC.1
MAMSISIMTSSRTVCVITHVLRDPCASSGRRRTGGTTLCAMASPPVPKPLLARDRGRALPTSTRQQAAGARAKGATDK